MQHAYTTLHATANCADTPHIFTLFTWCGKCDVQPSRCVDPIHHMHSMPFSMLLHVYLARLLILLGSQGALTVLGPLGTMPRDNWVTVVC
jgi:hypothetical protein